jgi:hypothetical protein
MSEYKFKIYTGPTTVKEVAEALRTAGVYVFLEGTEHVYITSPCESIYDTNIHVQTRLLETHGKRFGILHRDFSFLGEG